ncbi:MAG: hypothetical protein Wins2KO_02680 [Winogradskyella sp.]
MKIKWISLLIITLVCFQVFAQSSPQLELTGSKSSFTKGTIDVEVLTQIIQEKQEEIKQRVFRNTIISQFNKYKHTERLNNFTTYNYLYKMMDVLTSGKNKTVMTKSITESTAEFAFVYGLVLYANNTVVEDSKIVVENNKFKIQIEDIKTFNIYVDMCLDILLNSDEEFLKNFNFKETLNNSYYKRWYKNDNKYLKYETDPTWIAKRADLEKKIKALFQLINQVDDLFDEIESVNNVYELFENINEMDTDAFNNSLNGVGFLTTDATINNAVANVQSTLTDVISYTDNNSENLMHLINFYKGLKKSNFKDFKLTEDQYYAMKFIVRQFIDHARAQYKNNDVIASVLDFLLENTLVEFEEGDDDSGYLYMDIESLIVSIYDSFGSVKNKGILNYVTPFLSIGTNYGSFNHSDIIVDNNGSTDELNHLYYASEKIGIKYKIWNWKYTHSFKPGESFNYYGRKNITWRRPQQEPLISDLYVFGYGSGLLYNLIDVKSESEFDYAIFGAGVGITFFNGLSVNASIASPLISKKLDNSFLNIGLDIPIIEYIGALSKKQ